MPPKKIPLDAVSIKAAALPEPAPAIVPPKVLAENYTSPSRVGTRGLTGHFDPLAIKQLKLMAVEQDTTMQSLQSEALNLLFIKYGKSPIA